MDLTKFKDSIGKQLFAISGWFGLLMLFCWYSFYKPDYAHAYSIFLYLAVAYIFIFLSVIIYVVELIIGHKIKNTFLLENRIYNVFFIVGAIISVLFVLGLCLMFLSPILIYIYSLFL